MKNISIEEKIKVLEQLYVKEKDEDNKLLILNHYLHSPAK